jgi:hypothetical protein
MRNDIGILLTLGDITQIIPAMNFLMTIRCNRVAPAAILRKAWHRASCGLESAGI